MDEQKLANYAKEKSVCGQRSYTGACGIVFSFCGVNGVWK